MNNFLLSTASQQEIQSLDNKIHETVETINSLKTSREFFLSYAKDPQLFIDKWWENADKDFLPITSVLKAAVSVSGPEDDDGRDWQPWGGEESGLLLSTLGQRVSLQASPCLVDDKVDISYY